MKRRLVLVALLSGLSPLAIGWAVAAPDPKPAPNAERVTDPLTITEADNGKTLQTKVGSTIEVRLVGEMAGAGWEGGLSARDVITEHDPKKHLEFTPAKDAKNASVGTYVFRYRAVAAGKVALSFHYVTPGGPIPMPRAATGLIRTFKMQIDVAP